MKKNWQNVLEIMAFEPVAGTYLNCEEDTCDR